VIGGAVQTGVLLWDMLLDFTICPRNAPERVSRRRRQDGVGRAAGGPFGAVKPKRGVSAVMCDEGGVKVKEIADLVPLLVGLRCGTPGRCVRGRARPAP
jgi:hypothetical protein